MKVLYGITNPAKLKEMKHVTESLGLEIIGLNDLGLPLPEVNETGKNILENAKLKARVYYEAFKMPVFSCDSGLYFDDLEEDLQPGTHVRRVNGRELTDDEMVEYYANLAKEYGGQLIGRYRNAIYFIIDEEHCFASADESLCTEKFMLVSKAHERHVKGFPLDGLSVDIKSGKYYHDMQERTLAQSCIDKGVKDFFEKVLQEMAQNKHV